MMNIQRFSMGVGDRFGREGAAQLRAFRQAEDAGTVITPVWNKSFREHSLIGTKPDDVRAEADRAVRDGNWKHPYFVDADHIGLKTVDGFLGASDFFTLDVADFIGRPAPDAAIATFVREMAPLRGTLRFPGVDEAFDVDNAVLESVGRQYLYAVTEAGKTFRHIAAAKDAGGVVVEVSVDEAMQPQTPLELFFILGAIAQERIPVQTIAPKFTGKFLKGIDYVGDLATFEREFDTDVAVVEHAIKVFGLPPTLKLSVHTGSDKFSIYPAIRRAVARRRAGLHLKTAGTTWLEELIGIALAGGRGLDIVKRIYAQALVRFDELAKPYATVIEIDRSKLPSAAQMAALSSEGVVRLFRHDAACPEYNLHVRQLLHIAFKLAAEMGDEFTQVLGDAREIAGRCVTENLFERHMRPLFLGA